MQESIYTIQGLNPGSLSQRDYFKELLYRNTYNTNIRENIRVEY